MKFNDISNQDSSDPRKADQRNPQDKHNMGYQQGHNKQQSTKQTERKIGGKANLKKPQDKKSGW